MMDSIASVLAPKLEVGQEALRDALRARDAKRATRIVKRVASAASAGRGSGAVSHRNTEQRAQEVRTESHAERGRSVDRVYVVWCDICPARKRKRCTHPADQNLRHEAHASCDDVHMSTRPLLFVHVYSELQSCCRPYCAHHPLLLVNYLISRQAMWPSLTLASFLRL